MIAGNRLQHHLRGEAIGEQRGDQCTGTGPDLDIKIVDRAIDEKVLDRAQRADFIDGTGQPAAGEDQRGFTANWSRDHAHRSPFCG